MKILVIGKGGREHAIAWKLAQSPLTTHIYCAPGNAGTYREPKVENIDIDTLNFEALTEFVKAHQIQFTVVGPEAPLVNGIVDYFEAQQLPIFGPSQAMAQLEGSKVFAKRFMQTHHIPTANAASFQQTEEALAFLDKCQFPIVIKADGLAEGKGVSICQDREHAQAVVEDFLSNKRFGQACERILIEEFLTGVEISFMIIADGRSYIPLASSQDHKARDNEDKGPNTGGMGAYSPAPMLDAALYDEIIQTVVEPTLIGMQTQGRAYQGFLYFGLMITPTNKPKVLEYNCRLGDPETQPILMRMQSDFADLLQHAIDKRLNQFDLQFDPRVALGVVLAEHGYPGKYQTGASIPKIKEIPESAFYKIFHAGTKMDHGDIVSNGGRVLCATALGSNYLEAQNAAYELTAKAAWDSAYYRTDIGYKALAYDSADQ